MSGDSVGLTWTQARYNIRHENGKSYETVGEALAPEIKDDKDGKVEIKFGTSMWDYAEALKSLSTDLEGVDTNTVIQKINKAQPNPFSDVNDIQAGATLDLSSFVKDKDTSGTAGSDDTSAKDKDTSGKGGSDGSSADDKTKPDAKKEQIQQALDYLSNCSTFNNYSDTVKDENTSAYDRMNATELDTAIKDATADGKKDLAAGLEQIKKDLKPLSNQSVSKVKDTQSDSEASVFDFQEAKRKLDSGESYTDIVAEGNRTARDLDREHYGDDTNC